MKETQQNDGVGYPAGDGPEKTGFENGSDCRSGK